MSTIRLSEIIDIEVFNALPAQDSPEKTVFFESGIITKAPLFDMLAKEPGKIGELPFWNDIDATSEVNYSTDNPADIASPDNIDQAEQIYRKAFVNKGWSESNLAAELVLGGTGMRRIKARYDTYFRRQWQRRLLATVAGVLADNVANYSSDMVHDVAVESIAAQTAATKFNVEAFTEAAYTKGDRADEYTAMAVHPAVMKRMAIDNIIDYMPDSEGKLTIPTYEGLRVIMDGSMPVTAGSTDGFKYTSVLFGEGAFAYGEGTPAKPTAIESDESQGNGAGIETLWVRKTWILHPFGYQQLTTPGGTSFTNTELATAAVWDRVIDRKNINMAFLITN